MQNYRLDNQWDVELSFEEDGTATACHARLVGDRAPGAQGYGQAERNRADRPAYRVGEELAASRALRALAQQLRAQAADDITDVNRAPAYPSY
ncbi:dsRBD fold-containing protein [Kitasatospora sp. NBC_01266]|uniref:dsRBD fold-containing protein n=1 Tax=Kitasatospora sp. NBC_01266 TaxID=2903572 RepID=UPI002E347991|nr:dsRBD fold-containing protein [Kitasatospora sp. NBC_01266]